MPRAKSQEKRRVNYVPDEVDRQLIRLLTVDGRAPYRDLARQVSLSETRVRARVMRLLQEGYIHIVAIPNLIKLGAKQMAITGIRVSANIEEIANILSNDDRVTFLAICAGSYDLLIEVVCRDNNSLLQLIQKIRGLPGVRDTESFLYLKTPKSLYVANPGVLDPATF